MSVAFNLYERPSFLCHSSFFEIENNLPDSASDFTNQIKISLVRSSFPI